MVSSPTPLHSCIDSGYNSWSGYLKWFFCKHRALPMMSRFVMSFVQVGLHRIFGIQYNTFQHKNCTITKIDVRFAAWEKWDNLSWLWGTFGHIAYIIDKSPDFFVSVDYYKSLWGSTTRAGTQIPTDAPEIVAKVNNFFSHVVFHIWTRAEQHLQLTCLHLFDKTAYLECPMQNNLIDCGLFCVAVALQPYCTFLTERLFTRTSLVTNMARNWD